MCCSTWLYQLAALGCSLGMALAGGALTGLIITKVDPVTQVCMTCYLYVSNCYNLVVRRSRWLGWALAGGALTGLIITKVDPAAQVCMTCCQHDTIM
jgi:hypothetical protein